MLKTCPQCKSYRTVKNGKKADKQRYLCKDCFHVWTLGKSKKKSNTKDMKLLHEYVHNDAKYRQLAEAEQISIPTVQKRIDAIHFEKNLGTH